MSSEKLRPEYMSRTQLEEMVVNQAEEIEELRKVIKELERNRRKWANR